MLTSRRVVLLAPYPPHDVQLTVGQYSTDKMTVDWQNPQAGGPVDNFTVTWTDRDGVPTEIWTTFESTSDHTYSESVDKCDSDISGPWR